MPEEQSSPETEVPEPSARPYWLPAGVTFEDLSEEMRAAVEGVLNPAYHELVIMSRPGLEQSTGITIVHQLWLEIIDQIELGRQGLDLDDAAWERRDMILNRLARTIDQKMKVQNFYLRLQEFCQRWGHLPGYQAISPVEKLRVNMR